MYLENIMQFKAGVMLANAMTMPEWNHSATLKKEKLYRMNTTKMTVEQVKSVVFRYVLIYYNRKRISTVNPGGLLPSIFREQ